MGPNEFGKVSFQLPKIRLQQALRYPATFINWESVNAAHLLFRMETEKKKTFYKGHCYLSRPDGPSLKNTAHGTDQS